MAAAVDDLSGGRLQLGLGAGWQEREHEMFGLDLLPLRARMRRFQEGMDVVTSLLKSDEAVSYQGDYYQLKDAILLPRPQRQGGPPITVGGNGQKRTLQLAAKYADEWNAVSLTPRDFRERCQRLDEFLIIEGRQPREVRRSLMTGIFFGRQRVEKITSASGKTAEELQAAGRLVGEANAIIEQLDALVEAGCQRVMLQWLDQDDLAGLEEIATQVLPHFK